MSLYQLLIPLFCLFMIAMAFSSYRRGNKTGREFAFWLIFWLAFAFFGWDVSILVGFAHLIGFETGSNALFVFAILILFYLLFRTIIALENLESKFTQFVRKQALKQVDKR